MGFLRRRATPDSSIKWLVRTLLTPSTSTRVESPEAHAAMERFLEAQLSRTAQVDVAEDMATQFESEVTDSDSETRAESAQRIAEAFLRAAELASAEIDLAVAQLNVSTPNLAERTRDIQRLLDGYKMFGIPRVYKVKAEKWQERAATLRANGPHNHVEPPA